MYRTVPSSLKILIVDDHPIFRSGLNLLLNADPLQAETAEASCVIEAVNHVSADIFDLALVDVHLPDGTGFDLCQKLKAIQPSLKIILITALHEQLIAGWSLQFGADGMICKDTNPQEIITIIKKSLRGEPAFHPRAYQWLMKSLRGELSEGLYKLSQRELTVMSQISQGKNSKEIAIYLDLSPRTIETHNRNIREKLRIPHHDALVQVATLLLGHGGGHAQVNQEAELLSEFEMRTLSSKKWTHNAHLTISFLYLSRLSFAKAYTLITDGIKRLNDAHQNQDGFHATVTYAYSVIIKSRLGQQPIWMTAKDFIGAHPYLNLDPPFGALHTYFSKELLESDEARRQVVEADLSPLPHIKKSS